MSYDKSHGKYTTRPKTFMRHCRAVALSESKVLRAMVKAGIPWPSHAPTDFTDYDMRRKQ